MAPQPQQQSTLRSFLRNTRGVLVFAGLTVNTIFWFVPLLALAMVKLLLPIAPLRRGITRVLMWIGESWVAVNTHWLGMTSSIDWRGNGLDSLRRDGWYMVVANHQTWVDILVLQAVFNRRVPFLKFFIKQELIWFPFLGIAWWALDMPFMKRYSASYLAKHPDKKGKDLETTRRACEKFRDTPTSVLNFIEGTRFSEEKRLNRNSPYHHLLKPRAGGLAIALASMGELFTSVVDTTLVYPDGPARFWDMCCGKHVRVDVSVREIPVDAWLVEGDYENDREFRKRLNGWLGELWSSKDAIIDAAGRDHG